jgi:hypothetical protein
MSAPSFAQLFRRSRYSRFDPSENDKRNQERLEVFAVAAVGFALEHDTQFKKNFLKEFVGLEEDVENYKVSIQAADCIDLELKNLDKNILVAIEFKVEAGLADHQNPWLDARKFDDNSLQFWCGVKNGKNGYGYQLGQKDYDNAFESSKGKDFLEDEKSVLMLPDNSIKRSAWVDKRFRRYAKHLAKVIPAKERWKYGR